MSSMTDISAETPNLNTLQQAIGHHFSDPALLQAAITHTSHVDAFLHAEDCERLEFLGDAVLGMVIADMLYHLYPNEREGELARRKAALVCRDTLATIAQHWGVDAHLRLSQQAINAGGRTRPTLLEDACEAILGATYKDGGFDAARAVITQAWQPLAKAAIEAPKDPKTALQEWAQARSLPLPEYTVIAQEGPAHEPVFTIEVKVDGQPPCTASGKSKKAATTDAAQQLLTQLEAL